MAYELFTKDIPRIRGVLFDMDGLVLDTEKLYCRFWAEAAQALGFPMTHEQSLGMRSLNKVWGQEKLTSYFGPEADYSAIREKRIELMNAYVAVHGIDPKPGIRELLDYLDQNDIRCAITSSSPLPWIEKHLGGQGLAHRFTALCSGHNMPNGKPAPDIYLAGAAAIGVAPEHCLAIEDSPAGLEAAWRAGCMPIIVPDQDQPSDEVLSRCFARADSLFDVMELIG